MRVRRLVALLLTVLVTGSACQGAAGPSASVAPSASTGASLMGRLASEGDIGLFDARYLTHVADDAVLYVGTKDGAAIGYLCDPAAGSRWFTGTATGGQIDLHDAKGGRVTGPATADVFEATVSSISGYDGTFKVPVAGPGARLIRERDVPAGQVVGGLVFDGEVVSGVVTVSLKGTIGSGSASAAPRTAFAIGVKATPGPRADLTISTNPILTAAQQRAVDQAMKDARDKVEQEREAATTQFYLACVGAAVTMAMAGAGMSGLAAASVAALKDGRLSDIDASPNAFLSNALKGIVDGLHVTTTTPRPSSSSSRQAVTLGTITYGSFSGAL